MTGGYIVLWRERGKREWNIYNKIFPQLHAAQAKQAFIERGKPNIETMRTWCEL